MLFKYKILTKMSRINNIPSNKNTHDESTHKHHTKHTHLIIIIIDIKNVVEL